MTIERILQIRKQERPFSKEEEDLMQPSSALFEKKAPDKTLEQLSQLYDNLAVYADYLARLTAEGLGDNVKYEDNKLFTKTVNQAGLTLLKKSNDIKDEFNNASYCFYKVEKPDEIGQRLKVGSSNESQRTVEVKPRQIIKLTENVEVDLSENLLLSRDNTARTLPLFKNYTEPYPSSRNPIQPLPTPPAFTRWTELCRKERAKREVRVISMDDRATGVDSVIEKSLVKEHPMPEVRIVKSNPRGSNSSRFLGGSQRLLTDSVHSTGGLGNLTDPVVLPLMEPIFPDSSVYKEESAFHKFRKRILVSKKHMRGKNSLLLGTQGSGRRLDTGSGLGTISLTSLKSYQITD